MVLIFKSQLSLIYDWIEGLETGEAQKQSQRTTQSRHDGGKVVDQDLLLRFHIHLHRERHLGQESEVGLVKFKKKVLIVFSIEYNF